MCCLVVNHLPPKWKTYIVPSKTTTAYSFLLKQKREFQQFINGFESQVSNMSSCYIIDKRCSADCTKDMNIYIFDRSEYYKTLQLKILVPKEHLMKKISLLIRLSSKNNAVAKSDNLGMFIRCKEGHIWETFYNIFEYLLKKSSLNLIGTQFYVPLVCKYLILNELRLLHSLSSRSICRNTKQVLVKSSSSKPSLKDTFIQESANDYSKPPVQQTGVTTCNFNILIRHEIKQSPLNMTLKGKSLNDIQVKTVKVSDQFCKKLKCKCHERNKWKVFKQFTQCSIVNYVDLLKDNIFNDSELSQLSSTQTKICPIPVSVQEHENNRLQFGSYKNLLSKVRVSKNDDISLNSSHQVMNTTSEEDLFKTKKIEDKKEIGQSGKLYERDNKMTSNKTIPYLEKDDYNSQYYLNHNKKNLQEVIEIKQNMESSNNILIENECLKTPLLSIPAVISTETDSKLLQVPFMGFQSMSIKKHANTEQISKGFQSMSIKKHANTEQISKSFQSIRSRKLNVSPNSFQRASKSDCNVMNPQPIGFQTAAGKSLNISEKAFLAAQKMFEEVCSQEINVLDNEAGEANLPNNPAFKKPAYPGEANLPNNPAFKKPAYPDENYQMDIDFNSDFADKFFEENPFDDKEIELKPKVDLMQSPLPNLNRGKSKVRKSLGGRRILKPYAMKK